MSRKHVLIAADAEEVQKFIRAAFPSLPRTSFAGSSPGAGPGRPNRHDVISPRIAFARPVDRGEATGAQTGGLPRYAGATVRLTGIVRSVTDAG